MTPDEARELVGKKYSNAMCVRSPSSGGWKIYLPPAWIALSATYEMADEAWIEVAEKLKKETVTCI